MSFSDVATHFGQQRMLNPTFKRCLDDMVLLEIDAGEVDPFYAHTVWQDARPVGIVSSGAYGHRTGKVLALAYMRDISARSDLTVSILGQKRPATIMNTPPFDPNNIRLKTGVSS